jgi:hypothetical protein
MDDSAFKLDGAGNCPVCGSPPAERGHEENELDPDVQGDLCTHPCHDESREA